MNASRRWAYHFVANLECVNCRRKDHLRLFGKRGDLIISEHFPLKTLIENAEDLEVWCRFCIPDGVMPIDSRRRYGRREHKQQAAKMAILRAVSPIAARYDTYTFARGNELKEITKQQLVGLVLDNECFVCHTTAATKIFFKGRNVVSMASEACTIDDIIDVLPYSTPCCNTCFMLLRHSIVENTQTFVVDGNFYDDLFHL